MTTFNLYDADGRIHQSNKVYDPKGYEDRLRDAGHSLILATDHGGPLHPDDWHVKQGALSERPAIPLTVSRRVIKAGGTDGAKIKGAFAGATVTVKTSGMVIFKELVNGNTIDVSIPVPCLYEITIERWPCRPAKVVIVAEA